jgi:hypothetical protein
VRKYLCSLSSGGWPELRAKKYPRWAGEENGVERLKAQGLEKLSGEVFGFASRTVQGDLAPNIVLLKDDFDILVKAGLAHVVHWLRRDWIPIMTEAFGEIGAVDKGASRNFVERITPAIRDEFFHCAQLLQCLEVALLQLAHLETVSQESFLSLQNLLIHLRDHSRAEIFGGNK